MRQLEVENKLRDVVSRIIVQVELATAQGRTDINLALEDAFIPILRSIFNLPQLINLNRKQKNFPGIDLGDDHDRVCFQVTLSRAAALMAFSSRSATTPTKSPIRTTATRPGISLTEDSSTAIRLVPTKSPASTPA